MNRSICFVLSAFLTLVIISPAPTAFAVTTAGNSNSSQKTIKMDYFMLPPHTFKNEGDTSPRGAGITHFEAVAAKIGYQVEWIGPLPLPRLTKYLGAGTKLAGTVGFPKYPVFEGFMYYADKPLYFAQATLGVKKGSPLSEIKSIDDIRGFNIGAFESKSNRFTPIIDDNRDAVKMHVLGMDKWMSNNLLKMMADRLDALFDRQPYTMKYEAAKLKIDKDIKMVSFPGPAKPMYVVFSKASEQGKTFLDSYNSIAPLINLNYEDLLQKELDAVSSE